MTPLMFLGGYLGLSLLIGLMGEDRKFGFWGYFFGSLLFSPFIGIILVLASDPDFSDVEE